MTPDLLQATGIRVKVKLHKFNPMSLAPIGNGLSIASSLGVVDKRTMISTLGITTDPDGMLQRIEDEALEQVPEVLQARTLKRYVKQAEEAAEREDFDTAEELLAEVQFIAEQLQQIQQDKQLAKQDAAMQNQMQQGQLAQGPQPQGQSLPSMGTPTGTEGGRPPGPPPPMGGM